MIRQLGHTYYNDLDFFRSMNKLRTPFSSDRIAKFSKEYVCVLHLIYGCFVV